MNNKGILSTVFGILLLGIWSCNISESENSKNYVSLTVPDSLRNYESVRILLVSPTTRDTLDTLWNAPIKDTSYLENLPTRHYKGGKVDVVIQAKLEGQVSCVLLVEYRSSREKPESQLVFLKDKIPPEISVIGPDSSQIFELESKPTIYALCRDDQDKNPMLITKGKIDSSKIGRYEIIYSCQDSSGNTAVERKQVVRVIQIPDTVAPILSLIGSGERFIYTGQGYVDSGAICMDERDGKLSVSVLGAIQSSIIGNYDLTFTCVDKSNNKALDKIRKVHVIVPPDTTAPDIRLKGLSSVTLFQGSTFTDSGAYCLDAKDGVLDIKISGAVVFDTIGNYSRTYTCQDSASNSAEVTRFIKVVEWSLSLSTIKDATVHLNAPINSGLTPFIGFSNFGESYLSILEFDLSQVDKSKVTSAKARFKTFGWNTENWGNDSIPVAIRIYRMKKAWIEGTGSWYYHDGGYKNSGDIFLGSSMPIRSEIKNKSSNPSLRDGISSLERENFLGTNIEQIGTTQLAKIYFPPSKCVDGPNPKPIPKPSDLVDMDIDLTEYVKSSPETGDHGLYITVEGLPTNWYIAWISRDGGDGTLGPKLLLSY